MKRAVCIALLCMGFWVPVVAKTITVDLNGGGDFTEIQPAIDAATDGATVLVQAGECVFASGLGMQNPASLMTHSNENLLRLVLEWARWRESNR